MADVVVFVSFFIIGTPVLAIVKGMIRSPIFYPVLSNPGRYGRCLADFIVAVSRIILVCNVRIWRDGRNVPILTYSNVLLAHFIG